MDGLEAAAKLGREMARCAAGSSCSGAMSGEYALEACLGQCRGTTCSSRDAARIWPDALAKAAEAEMRMQCAPGAGEGWPWAR